MNKEYLQYLEQQIKPFLKEKVRHDFLTSFDGARLSYYEAHHPEEKASIVIVHGFCEFFGKYHEVMMRFYQEGYSVFFLELRGHGKSDRTGKYTDGRITIGDFDDYAEDVRFFTREVVQAHSTTGRLYLFAHSMGGLVGARVLEEFPQMFAKAVLSSPLLRLNLGKVPDWTVPALGVYSKIAGNEDDYAPGQHAFTGEYAFENSSCMDRDRYEYQYMQRLSDPDYQTWGSTWSWVRAVKEATDDAIRKAGEITVPVLVLQAGNDALVKPEGQNRFVRKSKNAELVRFEDSKHEIYNATDEIRREFYRVLFAFYDE